MRETNVILLKGANMKNFLSGLCSLIAVSFCLVSQASAATLKIVALVNGEIISSEDIQNRVNAFLMTTGIPYNAQTRSMINQRVLNAAVDEKIKLQEAAKNNIEVSEEEIGAQLRQFEKSRNIPMGQLNTLLRQAGVSRDTIEEQMKSDIAWVRLVRKKSYAEGSLTQKEIEKAMQEAKSDLTTPKYQVSEIFIRKDHARNLSDLVYNLRHDPRFELYAMQFSESPSAANGGNLGWVNSGKLASALESALKKMKPGEISEPISVGDGYYILKLQKTFDPEKDKPELPSENEMRVFLQNQKMEAISKKLLQDLRQQAVIEIRS